MGQACVSRSSSPSVPHQPTDSRLRVARLRALAFNAVGVPGVALAEMAVHAGLAIRVARLALLGCEVAQVYLGWDKWSVQIERQDHHQKSERGEGNRRKDLRSPALHVSDKAS